MPGARTASKDLSLTLLGGLMVLKVDALNTKVPEETVKFPLICPGEPTPVKPRQMYVHPDDLDATKGPVRMWTAGECAHAREVDGILYPVTDEQMAAAKEPVLPPGEITVTVFDAATVEQKTRPGGAVYRLRPKSAPQVYSMLVDLIADPSKAFIGEMTMRNIQRMYRLQSWNGVLILQELIRPGEFYDAEDYTAEYPSALLSKMRDAVNATVSEFDPDEYASYLRDRARSLDEAVKDPNVAAAVVVRPVKKKDDVNDLLGLLDSVVASAKKPTKRAK